MSRETTAFKRRLERLVGKSKTYSLPKARSKSKRPQLSDEGAWNNVQSFLDAPENEIALSPVHRAFEEFNLNILDPHDWLLILMNLSEAVFPRRRVASGRPKIWGMKQFCALLEAVDRCKVCGTVRSDSAACKLIAEKKTSCSLFRNAGAQGLLKQLKLARTAKHNPAIMFVLKQSMRQHEQKLELAGFQGKLPLFAEDIAEAERHVADVIAQAWRTSKNGKKPSPNLRLVGP